MPFVKPTVLHVPRTQAPEGYEESFDIVNDGVISGGFFPQDDTTPDDRVGVYRLGEDLVFEDPNAGIKTLYQLASAAGLSVIDFLLDCDPNAQGMTYVVTYTSSNVTKEEWTTTATSKLLKSADYTYLSGKAQTAVTKVFGPDGTTIIGQTTETFSYSGSKVIGSTLVRDV